MHTCEFLIKGLNEASTFDLVGIRHLHEYGDSVSDLDPVYMEWGTPV